MSTDNILCDTSAGILTITLNRPEKKNALNKAMYERIMAALGEAQNDDSIRVVLLKGQENCFTAGNDLGEFKSRKPDEMSTGIRMLEILARFEKPLVAAVGGIAIGIGTTMLLHCDLVYAATQTRFRLPFVPLGLVPEGASTLLIPAYAGHRRASELFMLGDFFGPRTALDAGIINAEIPAELLFEHARAAAVKLASQPQLALLETKRLMKQPTREQVLKTIQTENQIIGQLVATPESQAARKAAIRSKE